MAGSFKKNRNQRGIIGQSFSKYLLASAIFATVMDLNIRNPSTAMAQPALKKEPSKDELTAFALTAFKNFRDFVITGNDSSRAEFKQLWDSYSSQKTFEDAIYDQIQNDPEGFKKIVTSYKEKNGDWPTIQDLFTAVDICYVEFKKDNPNIEMLNNQYGEGFVSSLNNPEEKPRVKEAKPKKVISKISKIAEEAAKKFKEFVTTGDNSSRDEFWKIYQKNKTNEEFLDALYSDIKKNPQIFKELVTSYESKFKTWPDIEQLYRAVNECYFQLKKPELEQDLSKITEKYGHSFVTHLQKLMEKKVVPVKVPGKIESSTIDYFINQFGIDVPTNATEDQKMQRLVDYVKKEFYLTNNQDANDVTNALLRAYTMLETKHKPAFGSFILLLSKEEKKEMASNIKIRTSVRSLSVPYEYVKSEYMTWVQGMLDKKSEASKLELELKKFPGFIQAGSLTKFTENFEKSPSDYNLEVISKRLEFVQKKIQSLKAQGKSAKEFESEQEMLVKWFSSLGLEDESPKQSLGKLQAGLLEIQINYYEIDPNDPRIIKTLISVESNKKMSLIYKMHLSEIDKSSGKLFLGIPVSAKNYTQRIAERIGVRLSPERVKRGQAAWYTDYYNPNAPKEDEVNLSQTEALMYSGISNLSPMAAIAFLDYLEKATDGGLRSDSERALIVRSAARLFQINPLLVVQYFSAIKNLAIVCEDNEEVFRQAMTSLSARIDAETEPILSDITPTQILPLNVRNTITNLSNALSEIALIEKSSIAQYDRLNLMDDRLKLRLDQPPHHITQEPPNYAPRLLAPRSRPGQYTPPYFLPDRILSTRPITPFTAGGVFTGAGQYQGTLRMPTFNPIFVDSGSASVGQAFEYYLDPQHPVVAISSYLPGVTITGLSGTKLLNEIARAFIPTSMPDYSGRVVEGGGGAGISGKKTDKWDVGGAGLGTFITPSGGVSIGGAKTSDRIFGGLAALAVPIGYPVFSPGDKSEISGIDSAIAGHEVLDSGEERSLVRVIQTAWDPKNPSQTIIALNREKDIDGKKVMTARYFYIDKQGKIFELKGGQNDFLKILNYIAGYGNKNFQTPSTYAWNFEPEIERGGGALAIDIGKSALLAHYQAVPFYLEDGQEQPLFIQWTPGFANTKDTKDGGTLINTFALPGQLLRLRPITGGSREEYVIQDIDYTVRKVKGQDAWEVNMGGGAADTPIGVQGRGGFFIKTQSSTRKSGGGLFYEAGATNLESIALLSEAEGAQRYIESLHRVGMTVYHSKETANRLLVGGLAHVVEQLRDDYQSGLQPDVTFYRFIGILKGLKSAARLELGRYSTLDAMLTEYEQMGRDIGQDPSRAAGLLQAFQNKYQSEFRNVMDDYFLGVQILPDLSLEAYLLNKEEGNDFVNQKPNEASARVLLTWKTGFWRAFAAIPLRGESARLAVNAEPGTTTALGVAGTGIGQNLLNGFFMQRVAADIGLLFARYETGDRSWTKQGWFVQGAIRIWSSVLEDVNEYRKLAREFEKYKGYVDSGAISKIPLNIRNILAADNYLSDKLRKIMEAGMDVKLSEAEVESLQGSLYRNWFEEEKFRINYRFHGNFRAFAGASGYIFGDTEYYDIAVFVEQVNRFRAYVIGSQRNYALPNQREVTKSTKAIYAGTDIFIGNWTGAAMLGATERGDLSASASIGYTFNRPVIPITLGLSGFAHSQYIPEYSAPFIRPREQIRDPEFGALFFFTIGSNGVPTINPGFENPSYPNR